MQLKKVRGRAHSCRTAKCELKMHWVSPTCRDLLLGGHAVHFGQPQEFRSIPSAAIIDYWEYLPTESNAEATSTKHITVASWKLQRCSGVHLLTAVVTVHMDMVRFKVTSAHVLPLVHCLLQQALGVSVFGVYALSEPRQGYRCMAVWPQNALSSAWLFHGNCPAR